MARSRALRAISTSCFAVADMRFGSLMLSRSGFTNPIRVGFAFFDPDKIAVARRPLARRNLEPTLIGIERVSHRAPSHDSPAAHPARFLLLGPTESAARGFPELFAGKAVSQFRRRVEPDGECSGVGTDKQASVWGEETPHGSWKGCEAQATAAPTEFRLNRPSRRRARRRWFTFCARRRRGRRLDRLDCRSRRRAACSCDCWRRRRREHRNRGTWPRRRCWDRRAGEPRRFGSRQ